MNKVSKKKSKRGSAISLLNFKVNASLSSSLRNTKTCLNGLDGGGYLFFFRCETGAEFAIICCDNHFSSWHFYCGNNCGFMVKACACVNFSFSLFYLKNSQKRRRFQDRWALRNAVTLSNESFIRHKYSV